MVRTNHIILRSQAKVAVLLAVLSVACASDANTSADGGDDVSDSGLESLRPPTTFTASDPTFSSIAVSWTPSDQGSAIEYHVKDASDDSTITVVAWPATSAVVAQLESFSSYTFYVVTSDGVSESAPSNQDSATTLAPPGGPSYTPTHFVRVGGAGDHDGSLGNEWTLKEASDNASPGNTIEVADGTYSDSTATPTRAYRPALSGTVSEPIVFYSKSWRGAVIRANVSVSVPAVAYKNRSYITWDGFRFDGGIWIFTGSGNVIKNNEFTSGFIPDGDPSLGATIRCESQEQALIRNNYCHSMPDNGNTSHNSAGIMLIGNNRNSIVENNSVEMSGSSFGGPYGTKGGNDSPTNNTWRYNFGNGGKIASLVLLGKNTGQHFATVHNNVFINGSDGIQMDKISKDHQIYNNTIYSAQNALVAWTGCVNRVSIFNNIIAETSRLQVFWGTRDNDSPGCSSVGDKPWSTWLDLLDWNNYSGDPPRFASYTDSENPSYATLAEFVGAQGFDANSVNNVAPNFVNAGGQSAEDYKRNSYPSDGRGGSWPSVMGAYVTGNETIGYTKAQ